IERPSTAVKGVLFRCVTDVSRDKSSGRTRASMFGKGKRKLPLVAMLMQPRNVHVNRDFNNSCGRSQALGLAPPTHIYDMMFSLEKGFANDSP
ncbi:hypothetical protein Tco_0095118, partial [Tanacetum coccineum]